MSTTTMTTAEHLEPGDRIVETYETFSLDLSALEIPGEPAEIRTVREEREIRSIERRHGEMRVRHARPGAAATRTAWWAPERPVEVIR